jgi:hypothetical protein
MIGVISKVGEIKAVEEFFELFKTPWESYVPNREYNVVVTTSGEDSTDVNANLLLIYNSKPTSFDGTRGGTRLSKQDCAWIEWNGVEFPVYGDLMILPEAERPFVWCKGKSAVVGFEASCEGRRTLRIGYDLFQEVSHLLSKGQPSENAHFPTLEIHISLLRSMMVNAGVSFVEVPPVPAGYDFMACLTHDVDFTGIREHKFDHTLLGFIYRAFFKSFSGAVRGKLPWSRMIQNWKAVFSLPLVYLGLAEDFWLEFDRYAQIEKDLASTFYFIPFKNVPGVTNSGAAPKRRAAEYDVADIQSRLRQLVEQGCEVGLHGIDSWRDRQKARTEAKRICELSGQSEVGIRMHWLYFSEDSPKILEDAGLTYDSTYGYNDAIGFRGGTAQVFCPMSATGFLELPLGIQDSALFYPSRMGLSETEALESCKHLIEFMSMFGGALTVNWHTRSLSPERLWGEFYAQLLEEIQKHRVWFGTAHQITTWFRKRRELQFDQVQFAEDGVRVKMSRPSADCFPPFLVRVHHSRTRSSSDSELLISEPIYSDTAWKDEVLLTIGLQERAR